MRDHKAYSSDGFLAFCDFVTGQVKCSQEDEYYVIQSRWKTVQIVLLKFSAYMFKKIEFLKKVSTLQNTYSFNINEYQKS